MLKSDCPKQIELFSDRCLPISLDCEGAVAIRYVHRLCAGFSLVLIFIIDVRGYE